MGNKISLKEISVACLFFTLIYLIFAIPIAIMERNYWLIALAPFFYLFMVLIGWVGIIFYNNDEGKRGEK